MSEANRNVGRDVGTCANYSESCSIGARQPTNELRSLPQLNGSLAWAPRRGYLKTSRTHTQLTKIRNRNDDRTTHGWSSSPGAVDAECLSSAGAVG